MNNPDSSENAFQHPELTQDEWTVLEKIVRGVWPVQIAKEMNININWVRQRFSFLRLKYECANIDSVRKLVQAKGMPVPPASDA